MYSVTTFSWYFHKSLFCDLRPSVYTVDLGRNIYEVIHNLFAAISCGTCRSQHLKIRRP